MSYFNNGYAPQYANNIRTYAHTQHTHSNSQASPWISPSFHTHTPTNTQPSTVVLSSLESCTRTRTRGPPKIVVFPFVRGAANVAHAGWPRTMAQIVFGRVTEHITHAHRASAHAVRPMWSTECARVHSHCTQIIHISCKLLPSAVLCLKP